MNKIKKAEYDYKYERMKNKIDNLRKIILWIWLATQIRQYVLYPAQSGIKWIFEKIARLYDQIYDNTYDEKYRDLAKQWREKEV